MHIHVKPSADKDNKHTVYPEGFLMLFVVPPSSPLPASTVFLKSGNTSP